MPFKAGEKLPGQGGYRANAGRPKKQEADIRQAAAVLARQYIDTSVKPVMHTYFQLAHGRLVNKYHEGKIVGQEFEADAATTRHFVDKLLPDDKELDSGQTINILIAPQASQQPGSESEFRTNGLQIRVGGDNGKNGNGSNGA